jgi:general secretion pathway protein E
MNIPLHVLLDSAALRGRMPGLLDQHFREMRARECLLFDAGQYVELVSSGASEGVLLTWADLLLDRPVRAQRADRDDILALLSRHEETLRALDQLDLGVAAPTGDTDQALVLRALDDADSPVVRLVNSTLHDAMQNGASDIHMESHPGGMTLRYRLDGVLSKVGEVPGVETAEQMVSRIKVLAELDIAERRIPQDGRFRVSFRGRDVDLRVSIMPSVHGEDAVLRILDKQSLSDSIRGLRLESLSLEARAIDFVRELASRPHGMLLVTGPTGSGKTTTLYAAISEINTGRDKIVTIEDPVEYNLPGVLQIPVNEKKGLTFARGLRSILRHDPDRIMVGEIRDQETAQIAIQAALTGHLVFSSVHANNVFDVLGRFLQLGVDPYNFVSALNGVLAQRLLRVNCEHCAEPVEMMGPHRALLQEHPVVGDTRLMEGRGCGRCRGTGYHGRVAIAELLRFDDSMREAVAARRSILEVKRMAAERGTEPLRAAAVRLMAAGRTTANEVMRVTDA